MNITMEILATIHEIFSTCVIFSLHSKKKTESNEEKTK